MRFGHAGRCAIGRGHHAPPMNAVQGRRAAKVAFLRDHGADANATDHHGFTALHRAAEMGQEQVVERRLSRGASPPVEAQGQTLRSLAETRGEHAIVALFGGCSGQ